MEIDKLVHIVKNPINSNCKDIEIEYLKSKFPYCQTFTLISMMQKHQQGVFGFEEELEHSSHKIIDRGVLYDYLNSESKIEKVLQPNVEINEAKPHIKPEESEGELTQLIDLDTPINDQAKVAAKKTLTELDFDIINSAIDSSIQLEVDEELEKTQQLETETQEAEFKETNSEKENPLINSITEVTPSIQEPVSRKVVDSSPKSFISWLKSQETHSEVEEEELKAVPHSSASRDSSELNEEIDRELAKKKLLEKFISEEPRISKPKKEFFSPTKKAKESLTENDDLITETLAKIYVLQKNYNKAIDAYERLSLIYPEKNTFFADQIQRIKDKQNI